MTLTELIAKLTKLHEEHGNLKVGYFDEIYRSTVVPHVYVADGQVVFDSTDDPAETDSVYGLSANR